MLRDRFGRTVDYLRLSLTDRCDLRCSYCLPSGFHDFAAPASWLTPAEVERVVAAFAALGVRRVRLTGGEPLTRREALEIAARIGRLPGIEDLSLTTNGTQLARHAGELRRAGVRRLNVSLDTLDRRRFAAITGRDALDHVLAGLDAAAAHGFGPTKINMVAMAGVNDDEAETMADYCRARGFVLRLIEPMPMGEGGRAVKPADLASIRARLRRRFDLVEALVPGGGPARYLRSADGRFTVGFITPLSQHFCASCNRVRLSAEGTLYLCLGQDDAVDLGGLLRAGAGREALMRAIEDAVARKPERHEFNSAPARIVRVMAKTGG
jgi:cyclic pyranopterin phosphate synthase